MFGLMAAISTLFLSVMPAHIASPVITPFVLPQHEFVEQSDPLLVEGPQVLPPAGFVRFCQEYPGECATSRNGPVRLTGLRWWMLQTINRNVNHAIRPRPERGVDHWQLDQSVGDCDEYAVQKRHVLNALGFDLSSLSLTVVRGRNDGFHLVLLVRTDRGNYVLDNLDPTVQPASNMQHPIVMMQAIGRPRAWVAGSLSKVGSAPTLLQANRGARIDRS